MIIRPVTLALVLAGAMLVAWGAALNAASNAGSLGLTGMPNMDSMLGPRGLEQRESYPLLPGPSEALLKLTDKPLAQLVPTSELRSPALTGADVDATLLPEETLGEAADVRQRLDELLGTSIAYAYPGLLIRARDRFQCWISEGPERAIQCRQETLEALATLEARAHLEQVSTVIIHEPPVNE